LAGTDGATHAAGCYRLTSYGEPIFLNNEEKEKKKSHCVYAVR